MLAKIKNYMELKDAIIEVIRYLDCEVYFEEGASYTKEDIENILKETMNDAITEYYNKSY